MNCFRPSTPEPVRPAIGCLCSCFEKTNRFSSFASDSSASGTSASKLIHRHAIILSALRPSYCILLCQYRMAMPEDSVTMPQGRAAPCWIDACVHPSVLVGVSPFVLRVLQASPRNNGHTSALSTSSKFIITSRPSPHALPSSRRRPVPFSSLHRSSTSRCSSSSNARFPKPVVILSRLPKIGQP